MSGFMVAGDVAVVVVCSAVGPLAPRQAFLLVGSALGARALARIYRPRLRLSYFDDVPRALTAVCMALVVTLGFEVLVLGTQPPTDQLISGALVVLALGETQRAIALQATRWARRHLGRGERALVVGNDEVARELSRTMASHPEFGLRPVGAFDRSAEAAVAELLSARVPEEFSDIVLGLRVTTILLASSIDESTAVELATVADRLGCSVLALPRHFELYGEGRDVERLRSFPLVRLCADPTRRPSWRVKRALDRLLAACALVVLFPLMVVAALMVWADTGRPVIFSQERVGLGGRRFRLHKFRSLRSSEGEAATRWSIDDDDRVTRTGRLLRKTSIDELPQIWNILRGEMSLVGPRPERPVFVEEFSAAHGYYAARDRVSPGLTGLAQVNGLRGDTSIADRARYDNYYIASWSLWLDARIVVQTTGELLRHACR